jgi:Fe2+ or Zn2+ uptake regulation protein
LRPEFGAPPPAILERRVRIALQIRKILSKKPLHMQRSKAHSASESASHSASQSESIDRMLAGVRAAGLKLTPQRLAIVRELAVDESHPTAQELFERLLPSMPTMSFATVYNTLDALSSAGLCAALALSPGSGRFDPNMEPHHHLVCDACGLVRDLPSAPAGVAPRRTDEGDSARRAVAKEVAKEVAKVSPGFEVRAVERILRGLCAGCAGCAAGAAAARREGKH